MTGSQLCVTMATMCGIPVGMVVCVCTIQHNYLFHVCVCVWVCACVRACVYAGIDVFMPMYCSV